MPDRYGEKPDTDDSDALHAAALTVACRYCNAQPGERCVNASLKARLPTRIPHTVRTNDSLEVPF